MNKKTLIIIIISVVAVLLAAAAVLVFAVIIPNGKKIESINVYSKPEKTTYYVSDFLDCSGLEISVTLKNGDYKIISGEECTVSGFDSSKPMERQYLTVTYNDFTTGFYVEIIPVPVLNPTLVDIKVTVLPKINYIVGEELSVEGGQITLYYSDESTHPVDLAARYVSGFNSSVPNESLVLTVKYSENGVLAETTYTVTIKAE